MTNDNEPIRVFTSPDGKFVATILPWTPPRICDCANDRVCMH